MSDIRDWKTIAGSNADPSPDGFPEAMLRSEVNDSDREVMAQVKNLYDDNTYRRAFEDYVLSRTSGVIFEINDGPVESNAFPLLLVDQKIHLEFGGNDWYGFITNIGGYTGSLVQITILWIDAESEDTDGPAGIPTLIEVGPKFIKQAAWRNTGTADEEIPLMSDLDEHVTKPEDTLDVGFLDGHTHEQIEMTGVRGRLNVNGGLDFWQRGTSFTDSTSLNNDDENLCADNFVIISDGDDVVDVNRSSDVPDSLGLKYSMELTSATIPSNNKYGVITFIEQGDALDVSDPDSTVKLSVSFWAKIGSIGGIDQLRMAVLNLKNPTPTNHPVSAWGSGGQGVLTYQAADYELITGGSPDGEKAVVISTSWAQFTIEGLQVSIPDAASGAIALVIHVDESSISTGSKWLIAGVQFNRGDKALPFIRIPAATELALAHRYCETTFEQDVQPDHKAAGEAEALVTLSTNQAGGSSVAFVTWDFMQAKYKLPTLVTYNPGNASPATDEHWHDAQDADFVIGESQVSSKRLAIGCASCDPEEIMRIAAYVHANIWGAN